VSSDTRYLPLRRNTAHVPARIPTGHRPGRPPTATRLQRVNMEHLPKDEARRIAANIARLAELLGLLRRRGGRRLNRASATLRRGSRIAANITKLQSPVPIKRPFIFQQKNFYGSGRGFQSRFRLRFRGWHPLMGRSCKCFRTRTLDTVKEGMDGAFGAPPNIARLHRARSRSSLARTTKVLSARQGASRSPADSRAHRSLIPSH
jgi:hypothetical protein